MIIRTGSFPSTINTQQNQNANKTENTYTDSTKTNNQTSDTNIVDNSKKVEEIKQQIDDGTYKIDTQKSAEKMAQDLLLES